MEEATMHSVHLYIHENLDSGGLGKVKNLLTHIPHVVDVGVSEKTPHDFYVDYEERQPDIPMQLLKTLENEGLHPDIVSA
jgi:hypothetical protein